MPPRAVLPNSGEKPLLGRFDADHLKAIHRFVFQDVFVWAGQFRTVSIAKGGQLFGLPQFLDSVLDEVFRKLAAENRLAGLGVQAFSRRAGYYLGEINALHPFREGDGRWQREFIRELGVTCGHRTSWIGITREEMIDASIRSFKHGSSDGLAGLIAWSIAR